MEFTERSPIEEGFGDVFETEVRPRLAELEAMRRGRLKKTYRDMLLVVPAAGAVVGALYLIFGDFVAFRLAPLVVLFALIWAWVVWGAAKDGWTSNMEEVLMPIICAHVEDLGYKPLGTDFALDPLRDLKLLPDHDTAIRTSQLNGTYHSTGYQMVHATLTSKHTDANGSHQTLTLFNGLLFHIDVPLSAPGRIVLMRDRGALGNKLAESLSFGGTRSMPKVTFEHAAFEAAFEVYADRPDEAKAYMPDAFLDALLRIGAEQGQGRGAQSFVAGFEDASFYMALKRHGPFMKIGSLTTSAMDVEDDLHAAFDDIALSHRIIDCLHGV